ncbi:MAG: glycolate oxidase subunit GlcE [Gammaproteobacteria bacterium]
MSIIEQLRETVLDAYKSKTPLAITGGRSKTFFGRSIEATPLEVASNTGIINYEPSELVITVRAGTRLSEIETALAEHRQMLAFEPPHFGKTATLGGTIACGFSGPRRASAGAARDFILGTKIINGKGELLKFGGQVMKNVAGYDVSRLMTGALGTLGVLTELSLKVLPMPEKETSLCFECSEQTALDLLQQWLGENQPLSASSFYRGTLCVRLSGSAQAIDQTVQSLGGDTLEQASEHWLSLREQTHHFFKKDQPLWRVSLPPATPAQAIIDADSLFEWHGGQRWITGDIDNINTYYSDSYKTFFRNKINNTPFQPLPAPLLSLHQRIKQAMDPEGILNPGKIHKDF